MKKTTKYIIPKKEDLERWFNEYNEMYFDSLLSPCELIVKTRHDNTLAEYVYNKKRCKIRIARNVYWTDEKLKLTLIHEMVHHYVQEVLKVNSNFFSHGRVFRKVSRMLRKKYGLRVNLWELSLPHWKGKKKPSILKELTVRFISFILPT